MTHQNHPRPFNLDVAMPGSIKCHLLKVYTHIIEREREREREREINMSFISGSLEDSTDNILYISSTSQSTLHDLRELQV